MASRAIERMTRPFVEHPASVEETYVEHFKVAAGFARTLAVAAGAAALHAIVPSCCERSASRRIVELHERISSGHRAAVTDLLHAELLHAELAGDEVRTDELRTAG